MTPRRAPRSVWVTRKLKAWSDISNPSVYNREGQLSTAEDAKRRLADRLIRKPPFLVIRCDGTLLRLSPAIVFFLWIAANVHAAGLTESARLATVYDTILHARFDQARAELARTCPPAPMESCLALTEVVLWWEIQLDPGNHGLDKSL
jgi:hypothetical protein